MQHLYTPRYLTRWAQDVIDPATLPWKGIGAAAFGVLNSILGLGALWITWAVFGLWCFDLAFGVLSARKRGEDLEGPRFFDGVMKGFTIFALAGVVHLLEVSVRTPAGTEMEAGLAASVLLGAAAVSLGLSIRPNATLLWSDAGDALDKVGGAIGFRKNDRRVGEDDRRHDGPEEDPDA